MSRRADVNFLPWVGRHYGRGSRFGVSLLVLGESHYGQPEEECSDYTAGVVRTWAQQRRSRFFTVISKVLLGTKDWIDDSLRGEVWEHIAFYNFVQEFVGDGPRNAPDFRQWVEAQVPFKTIVQDLRPDAILVLGHRLREHILDVPNGVDVESIGHPSSSSMRYDDAIPRCENLVARAKARVGNA